MKVEKMVQETGTLVNLGLSVEDAIGGWRFVDVIDYGGIGIEYCHIGHQIRYGFIVSNPDNATETHIYGSECICKFWIAEKYKNLDAAKFQELYQQYHPLFTRFTKWLYLSRHYGLPITEFPQNLDDLKITVDELKDLVTTEKKRRKAIWKRATISYTRTQSIRSRERAFLRENPDFATLYTNYDPAKLRACRNYFYERFARDVIFKYEHYHSLTISAKQHAVIEEINKVLSAPLQTTPQTTLPTSTQTSPPTQSPQTNGNPELVKKLQTILPYITRPWFKQEFLPSLIRQLEYKTELSDKQKALLQKNKIDIDALYDQVTRELAEKEAALTEKLDLVTKELNLVVLSKRIRAGNYTSEVVCSRYPDYEGKLTDTDISLIYQYLTRTGLGTGLTDEDAQGRIKVAMLRNATWAAGWQWV
jgi:hypothetical protein